MKIINNLSGNHYQQIIDMLENADTLYIISPFLMESFDTFFDKLKNTSVENIHLITTLKSNDTDLLRKANTLHSFCSLCHTHGIQFQIYADNKLHGKIYIAAKNGECNRGILTSANFTDSGLNRNHECGNMD
jgi:HKD family nuclease